MDVIQPFSRQKASQTTHMEIDPVKNEVIRFQKKK